MNQVAIRLRRGCHQAAFLLAIMLFASCSPSRIENQQAIATEKPAEPQVTLSSPPMPTSSPMIDFPTPTKTVLPPENILKFQPFEIISELPAEIKPSGTLVMWQDSLQLLHFEPQVHLEIIPSIDPDSGCLTTSPDGKWLAHCHLSNESLTGQWLFVESADWQQQKRVPIDVYLIDASHLWLDNQHLVFTRFQGENRTQGCPVVVIDPFTGKQVKLASNYPGMELSPFNPVGTMAFSQSDVVYDPSLNLVIFPSAQGLDIVLWDRQSKTVLAKVDGAIGYYPLWSPDANQFLVPLQSSKEGENLGVEWFLVSRDGSVEQFTHFSDYFQKSEIGIGPGYSWSPDGQKLAFWLDISPSLCPGLNLALLDIVTKQVTDTCIPGSQQAFPPIWSLDSRYMATVNVRIQTRQVILVDTAEGRAFDITAISGDSRPIGWLISP